ncbi:MAG: hypothetical protein GXO26_06835, partial [Crenarchaeota archaeon]|nr:hypothetical protein [Thermoproteota archaeon]
MGWRRILPILVLILTLGLLTGVVYGAVSDISLKVIHVPKSYGPCKKCRDLIVTLPGWVNELGGYLYLQDNVEKYIPISKLIRKHTCYWSASVSHLLESGSAYLSFCEFGVGVFDSSGLIRRLSLGYIVLFNKNNITIRNVGGRSLRIETYPDGLVSVGTSFGSAGKIRVSGHGSDFIAYLPNLLGEDSEVDLTLRMGGRVYINVENKPPSIVGKTGNIKLLPACSDAVYKCTGVKCICLSPSIKEQPKLEIVGTLPTSETIDADILGKMITEVESYLNLKDLKYKYEYTLELGLLARAFWLNGTPVDLPSLGFIDGYVPTKYWRVVRVYPGSAFSRNEPVVLHDDYMYYIYYVIPNKVFHVVVSKEFAIVLSNGTSCLPDTWCPVAEKKCGVVVLYCRARKNVLTVALPTDWNTTITYVCTLNSTRGLVSLRLESIAVLFQNRT